MTTEHDMGYYARRRRHWQFVPADEVLATLECTTDAELGRYYRARVVAEQEGGITEAARRIAGKGPALECLERAEAAIVEDVERYRATSEQRTAAINKRWRRS